MTRSRRMAAPADKQGSQQVLDLRLRILAAIAGILLVLGLAAHISFPFFHGYHVALNKEPESQNHYSNVIYINGTVSTQPFNIALFVNDVPIDYRADDFERSRNHFKIKNVQLPYHRNKIEVRATTVRAWHELQASDSMTVTALPDPPTAPALSTGRCPVSTLPFVIRGIADPGCSVQITVNP